MADRSPESRINIEGGTDNGVLLGWPEGCDSFSSPYLVKRSQVRWLINAVTSGAVIQTRPGFAERLAMNLLEGSDFQLWWLAAGQPVIHPQMGVGFQPSYGGPQLVFAISGSVWFCNVQPDGMLSAPQQITTISFSPYADQLNAVSCIQTGTIVSGKYANNIQPRKLLVIQDGINRAAIWDGNTAVTMNPEKKITVDNDGNTLYTVGYNETRIGLWMAWSGNRLWVFNGNIGYASDLGDPTHFTEELTLNSYQRFIFPEPVTGAIDRGTSGTTRSQVVVTTRTTVWTLWSGVQARIPSDRAQGWVNTDDFMARIFSAVGCVAGKSLIVHRGLLYWQSEDGIVLFDSTATVYSTQNLPPIDQEMTYSKRRIASNSPLTCAGIRESYVFFSVPTGPVTNGRVYNYHTQVLDRQTTVVRSVGDKGPFSYGTTGWQGVWTGIRPIEWAQIEAGGISRSYAVSMDLDGVIRIWEAFQGNRADNGRRIPWQMETPLHAVAGSLFARNNFLYMRLLMDQVLGNVAIEGQWRGSRSVYHPLLQTSITATPGGVLAPYPGNETPYDNASGNTSFAKQSRDIRSGNVRGTQDGCSSAGVESPNEDVQDRAFSLWIKVEGIAAILAYRLAVDQQPDETEGQPPEDESGFNIVPEAACPQHLDGATPDFIMAETNPQNSFVPVTSKLPETDDYACPTL